MDGEPPESADAERRCCWTGGAAHPAGCARARACAALRHGCAGTAQSAAGVPAHPVARARNGGYGDCCAPDRGCMGALPIAASIAASLFSGRPTTLK